MANGSFIQVTSGTGPKIATGPTYTENANVVQDQKVILGEPYLATYALTHTPVTTGNSNSDFLEIMAGASLNVRIRYMEVLQLVLATTAAITNILLVRLTSAGSGGTAVTPRPLNPADSAAGATAMTLPSVVGGQGATIANSCPYFLQTANASTQFQQPIITWDFRQAPLIIPAGTSNGITIRITAAVAAATATSNVYFAESAF